MDFDEEYFCPNCGAVLNNQYGFDPDNDTWTCTVCGKELYGDDVYEGDQYPGVMWYCDGCGALLNKQDGFNDYCYSWTCTECGHWNRIDESEIYESKSDYENSQSSSSYDDDEDSDDSSSDSGWSYSGSESYSTSSDTTPVHEGKKSQDEQNNSNNGCCLVNLFSGCLGMILLCFLGLGALWLFFKILGIGLDILDWIF